VRSDIYIDPLEPLSARRSPNDRSSRSRTLLFENYPVRGSRLPYESLALFRVPVQSSFMIGAYTIGKKAVQFGYKRYGIPGAIATGGAALAGYLIVRRALKSSTNGGNVDSAIDAGEIQSAVEEKGLSAVTDTGPSSGRSTRRKSAPPLTWTTSSRRPKRRPTSSPTTRETATRAPIADRTPDHPSRDVCHPPVASHHRPDVFRAVTAFSLLDRQPVTDRNSQPEYEQARSHHRNRRQSRDRIRAQRIETQPRVRLEGAPVRPKASNRASRQVSAAE